MLMKIAIYSRGIENNQLQDINLLIDQLINHGAEPVFFQDLPPSVENARPRSVPR